MNIIKYMFLQKKVEKYNKLILENLLHSRGIKGVMMQFDIAYVLIIQPNNASLIEKSFSRIGNKGATREYPIPLNIFIQNKRIKDFFIFIENCFQIITSFYLFNYLNIRKNILY